MGSEAYYLIGSDTFMLKRKIYDSLVAWKQKSNGSTDLLIDGARRVGKSFIAEQFAVKGYRSDSRVG